MKRKAFGIGKNLRQGIVDTLMQDKPGTVFIEEIPIDQIEPDPSNPRKLCVSEDEMEWMRHAMNRADTVSALSSREEELIEIVGLAESIMESGLHQPIRVYRRADMYQIIFGERRYWASRLAGLNRIQCLISSEKPENIRMIQHLENMQRKDLDFAAKVRSTEAVFQEIADSKGVSIADVGATEFGRAVGIAARTARRYKSIILSSDLIRTSIDSGWVKGFREAAKFIALEEESPAKAQALFKKLSQGESFSSAYQDVLSKNGREGKGGPIRLVAPSMSAAKLIFERVFPDMDIEAIDWGDSRSVAKAWEQGIKEIEGLLSREA